jgi:hypothetical protein
MINFTDEAQVKEIQSNLRATFDSPQGREVMAFMEAIGGWYPSVYDSQETNAIIARDANRQLIGTLKTLLTLSPEQVMALAQRTKEE